MGQNNNIKIRIDLDSGESGLAKLVVLRIDENPPFDAVTMGLVGINLLTEK